MSWNDSYERKKFNARIKKEIAEYKAAGMTEEQITAIVSLDEDQYRSERRYMQSGKISLIHMPTVQNGQATKQTIGTSAPSATQRRMRHLIHMTTPATRPVTTVAKREK